jgi:glyoxylase-like metal-dependent hydrolase (beta-lactamase superfamily II)
MQIDKNIILETLVLGPAETNCYILGEKESLESVIIDPGAFTREEEEKILNILKRFNLSVRYIINTHGHSDHIAGNRRIKRETCAKILIHRKDAPLLTNPVINGSLLFGKLIISPPADIFLDDGEVIKIGETGLKVLPTPGHTKGGTSLLGNGFVFTGDTLFAGSIGRTDLPGGSLRDEVDSIKNRLFTLTIR